MLLVGWASENITPEKRVLLRGQFYERISELVHDPVMATALALESMNEDGSRDHAVLITCDLVGSDKDVLDQLREMMRGELENFDVCRIITCAIHTHTAPCVSDTNLKKLNWNEWERLPTSEFMTPGDLRDC